MLKASEVMSKEVATIRGSATVYEAVKLMKEKATRTLIVELRHSQDAYGIVTETDVVYKVVAYGLDPARVRVFEIMTKPCIVVNPDLGVEYVARLFANTGIHSAPVIQGGLLGLITLNDILTKGDFVEQPKAVLLESQLQEAIAHARQVCAAKGIDSPDCAAAWDIVEELRAEAAHQKADRAYGSIGSDKSAFEQYCEENPDAPEARMYDS
ncbi:MAG: CP12 domain-containing protein [Cyanobacteriota bacterium]